MMARRTPQGTFDEFAVAVWGATPPRPQLLPEGDAVRLVGVVPIDVNEVFPTREDAERALIAAIKAFREALKGESRC